MPVIATLALLACIPALALLRTPLWRSWGLGEGKVALTGSALGALVWLGASTAIPGVAESALRWPIAALAALAGYLCSDAARSVAGRTISVSVFCALWCALVFVPAAVLVFFPATFGFTISSSVWDLGGAVPVHVAGGAAMLALLRIRSARAARAGRGLAAEVGAVDARPGHVRQPSMVVVAGLVLWLGWAVALVALDMAIDSVTPLILRNALVVPLASVAGWLVVEHIRTRRSTLRGAAGGLVGGLVAVTPAGGSLSIVWAVALGVIVGIACGASALGGPARGVPSADRGLMRYQVATHLLAGSIGLLWVGLFGDGGGFVYTGQFSTVQVQLAVTIAVAGWGYVVAVLLSPMLRPRHPSR